MSKEPTDTDGNLTTPYLNRPMIDASDRRSLLTGLVFAGSTIAISYDEGWLTCGVCALGMMLIGYVVGWLSCVIWEPAGWSGEREVDYGD